MGWTNQIISVKVGEIAFETGGANEGAWLFRYNWDKKNGQWVKTERKVWIPKKIFSLMNRKPIELEEGGHMVRIPRWFACDNQLRIEEDDFPK